MNPNDLSKIDTDASIRNAWEAKAVAWLRAESIMPTTAANMILQISRTEFKSLLTSYLSLYYSNAGKSP